MGRLHTVKLHSNVARYRGSKKARALSNSSSESNQLEIHVNTSSADRPGRQGVLGNISWELVSFQVAGTFAPPPLSPISPTPYYGSITIATHLGIVRRKPRLAHAEKHNGRDPSSLDPRALLILHYSCLSLHQSCKQQFILSA